MFQDLTNARILHGKMFTWRKTAHAENHIHNDECHAFNMILVVSTDSLKLVVVAVLPGGEQRWMPLFADRKTRNESSSNGVRWIITLRKYNISDGEDWRTIICLV